MSMGTAWSVVVAVQRRGCYGSLIWIPDAESTYLLLFLQSLQYAVASPLGACDVEAVVTRLDLRPRHLLQHVNLSTGEPLGSAWPQLVHSATKATLSWTEMS
ncbi:unnamed protein product [Effrenium voratum]|uniref:Uncharacterized protein n=1 Tax=Effrenium voratum TaxID=2562239 RepID=A0AA36N415_9DINO|nr:unnamed protein product [Effrenium voratum]